MGGQVLLYWSSQQMFGQVVVHAAGINRLVVGTLRRGVYIQSYCCCCCNPTAAAAAAAGGCPHGTVGGPSMDHVSLCAQAESGRTRGTGMVQSIYTHHIGYGYLSTKAAWSENESGQLVYHAQTSTSTSTSTSTYLFTGFIAVSALLHSTARFIINYSLYGRPVTPPPPVVQWASF